MSAGMQVPENTPNSVSVKVSRPTYESLNDEQIRIRKETGQKRTFQELLDEAWSAHIRGVSGADREGAAVLDAVRPYAGVVPKDLAPYLRKLAKLLSGEDATAKRVITRVIDEFLSPPGRAERR